MNINLNDYSYSSANSIGNTLKSPLFKIASNIAIASSGKPWESLAWRIGKIAFHCFVAALFIIPAGLAWFIGKSICYFSKTQIDYDGLYLAPKPIELPQDQESDRYINIMNLSKKFNQLEIVEDPNQPSKKECLIRLCKWTATEDVNIYPNEPDKRKMFCLQLSIFLKGIIKKIESGEVSKDKERDILLELAEASTRCYPTWLEVSAKLYAEVNGTAETVEVKILRFIQEYKESIILEFSQTEAGEQWHALNYVRNILGIELGLNTTLNAHDPYAQKNDPLFSKALTKWFFLQRYENANRLVSGVQTMINSQNYDPTYYDFLVKAIEDHNINNAQDYVAEHFYDENYKLKEEGANLLLRSIGIIK